MELSSLVRVLKEVSPEVMESLDAEMLRALAAVSPDVLRALKDVPVEVLEALQPEVLAALRGTAPDQLQALRHVPPEVAENLSPELLEALPQVSPDQLQALQSVPVEVVENLTPELLEALPQVSPDQLAALQYVSPEVVENLSPELLHALGTVRPEVLHALKELSPEMVEALSSEILEALAKVPSGSEVPDRDLKAQRQPGAPPTGPVDQAVAQLVEALEAAGVDVVGHFGTFGGNGRNTWCRTRSEDAVKQLLANPDYRVAQVLSGLGSEVRLSILRHLLSGPRSASELVTELGMGTTGQAYHHLRELERTGTIEQREGRYCFVKGHIPLYFTALALAADAGAEEPHDPAQ